MVRRIDLITVRHRPGFRQVSAAGEPVISAAAEGGAVPASVGLSPEEIEEHSIGSSPRGRRIRSMLVTYEQELERPGEAPPISVGLAVPINTQLETVGLLRVFSRGEPTIFSEGQLLELQD